MSDHTEIAAQTLEQRYGARRSGRRPVVVALAVLLLGGLLAWAVWAAVLKDDQEIGADVASYQVVGTHEVRVKVDVHFRDGKATGTCLLRATASDHTVVGELNVTAAQLRADEGRWISMRTERRATTATVVRCSD